MVACDKHDDFHCVQHASVELCRTPIYSVFSIHCELLTEYRHLEFPEALDERPHTHFDDRYKHPAARVPSELVHIFMG